MSKGDRSRPVKDQKKFDSSWDRIFNKTDKNCHTKSDKKCHKENNKIGTQCA